MQAVFPFSFCTAQGPPSFTCLVSTPARSSQTFLSFLHQSSGNASAPSARVLEPSPSPIQPSASPHHHSHTITNSPGRPPQHRSPLPSDRCRLSLHHPRDPALLCHTLSLTLHAVLQCCSTPPLPNRWETTLCTSRGRPTGKPASTTAVIACIGRVNLCCAISQSPWG
jgi:hypothetical protein